MAGDESRVSRPGARPGRRRRRGREGRRSPTRPSRATRRSSARSLDAGADVNAAQVDGMTALHWAVYRDDAETAGLLVRAGANVNAANRYGVPPLSLACTNGNADLVALLLDAGADANAALPRRRNGSHDGGARGKSRGRAGAARAKAPTPTRANGTQQTALMWAAAEGHAAVVAALIDARRRHPRQAQVRVHAVVLRRRARATSTWCARCSRPAPM